VKCQRFANMQLAACPIADRACSNGDAIGDEARVAHDSPMFNVQ
jgi:hypothetical protein